MNHRFVLFCTYQVGNFVAYGDENTPASVVTAVGCVGGEDAAA